MTENRAETIIRDFNNFIKSETYPCVAARAAFARGHVQCYLAQHMACPREDEEILTFLYDFISNYRKSTSTLHSAAVIFREPQHINEKVFDDLLWKRLQNLSRLDAEKFAYDSRVSPDPGSTNFSFSIGEEALFIIGLHSGSERRSRQFKYPTLVFNPHAQFEALRTLGQYQKLRRVIRKRDTLYSGSVNPMLSDFGEESEALQYSGRQYGPDWKCPLIVTHERINDNSTKE